jgi:putative transposase
MAEEMYLTEQHYVKKTDPRYAELDTICFAAKNLWNVATYLCRQRFFAGERVPSHSQLCKTLKTHEAYKAMPCAQSAQQLLHHVAWGWGAFFNALKVYHREPGRFLGRPRPPAYRGKKALDRMDGRAVATWTNQSLSVPLLRKGIVKLSGTTITVSTKQRHIQSVRAVPRDGFYVLEIVYRHKIVPPDPPLDPCRIAGIDLGVNNLITLATNTVDTEPLIFNGGPLKAINNYYNKKKASLQALVGNRSSRAIGRLTRRRNRLVRAHLHVVSRKVVTYLVNCSVGTLVIGYNAGWKQCVNLGRVTNQRFVALPFAQLVDMIAYKAQLAGIQVVMQEESYTSKCSFFDGEEVCKHVLYRGKRVHRGLFRTSRGTLVNADLNGAYNIIRKAFPGAFVDGEAYHTHPYRVNYPKLVCYDHYAD